MRLPLWVVNFVVLPAVVGALALLFSASHVLGLMALSAVFGMVVTHSSRSAGAAGSGQ